MSATNSEVGSQLKKALFTYGGLKSRLLSTMDSGDTDMQAARMSKDDQCDLGSLIYDSAVLQKLNPNRYDRVRRAHKELHKQVGAFLLLATAGKRFEASKLVSPGSAFVNAWSILESELSAWCKEIH
jgi:hypothetical protein